MWCAHARIALLVLAAAVLTACGDNGGTGAGGSSGKTALTGSTPRGATSKPFLLKTDMHGFDGVVLPGSVLGRAPFCAGGSVHHTHGSREIGFPAINEITCGGSALRIGFGPGPDQMQKRIQHSDWRILDGTGEFAGATGSGQMHVEWNKVGGTDGHETFIGTMNLRSP
jgi:predicted small secreted protein